MILVDTMLYNPTVFLYNLRNESVMVYDEIKDRIYHRDLKLDRRGDKYINFRGEKFYINSMFNIDEYDRHISIRSLHNFKH